MALNEITDQWTTTIANLVTPLYNLDNSEGKGRVLSAIDSDLCAQAAARGAELKGWVNEAVEEFSRNDRRVARRAIEVAQRCVLAGLDPVAIVVETEQSLLRRWRTCLRFKVRAKIMKRSSAKKRFAGIKEEENEASWVSNKTEIRETKDLIFKLAGSPGNVVWARSFAIEAAEAEMDIWREVLEELDDQAGGAGIKSAVKEALNVVRTRDKNSALSEKELHRLCEPIWQAAKGAAG